MITRLTVRNFKAMRDVTVALGAFHVLVGPNGSGKSTLLDALSFIRDCVNWDLRAAVRRRADSLDELTFMEQGGAVEFEIEVSPGIELPTRSGWILHYFLAIQSDPSLGVRVVQERLVARPPDRLASEAPLPKHLMLQKNEGRDEYLIEAGHGFVAGPGAARDVFEFGEEYLALGRLPPDATRYPTAVAIRNLFARQVRLLNFVPSLMVRPCPSVEPDEFVEDGSNLARVASRILLSKSNGAAVADQAKRDWIYHLQLALPEIRDIRLASRPDDRAEYLLLHLEGGVVCPSWALSAGTLRMLALTLPAFLPNHPDVLLVEEPENGVHPHALEVIYGALRSIPKSQVMLTTHSPLVVDLAGKEPLLIFHKEAGAVQIQTADQHAALKDWDGSPNLSALFSAGYLQ